MSTMRSTNEAKLAELSGLARGPSNLESTVSTANDAAAASHPLLQPLPRWGALFHRHFSSAVIGVSSTYGLAPRGVGEVIQTAIAARDGRPEWKIIGVFQSFRWASAGRGAASGSVESPLKNLVFFDGRGRRTGQLRDILSPCLRRWQVSPKC